MKVNLFISANNELGEGPVWDESQNELLWVDIENKLLCFCNLSNGNISRIEMDSRIGAAVPTNQNNVYLVALQSGIKLYNRESGTFQKIANPEKHIQNNRFNDGKCDAEGRFWIGSMDLQAETGKGSLYCLDNELKLSEKLNDISISNGIVWSLDNKQMYYIDTATYKVVCFDYDVLSGTINNQTDVIHVPEDHGAPDGMCIDSEGMLWVAHWGGANVSRWNPNTGELIQKVEIPAPHVTSCCFGGKELDTLFITTGRVGLNEEQLSQFPSSGSVFFIKPEVKGCKSNKYKIGRDT